MRQFSILLVLLTLSGAAFGQIPSPPDSTARPPDSLSSKDLIAEQDSQVTEQDSMLSVEGVALTGDSAVFRQDSIAEEGITSMPDSIFTQDSAAVAERYPGADSTLIPRELFFKEKDLHRIRLARDGQRVYYQRYSAGEEKLFYRHIDSAANERVLTFDGPIRDWAPAFSGKLFVYLVDDETQRQFWLTDAEGKKEKNLVPFPFRELQIDALSRLYPEKVALRISAEDIEKSGIYIIDAEEESGDRISSLYGFNRRFYDGRLGLVAAVRDFPDGSRAFYVKEGENWREFVRYPFDEGSFVGGLQQILSVSEGGTRVYFTDNLGKDKTVLMEYDIELDSQRILVADARADILPYSAVIGPGGWPQMVLGLWAQPSRHYLHGEARQDFEWLDQQFGGGASFADQSADGRIWLVRRLNGGPTHYYIFRRSRRELRPLFSDYPPLDTFQLAARHAHTVITRDSVALPVHVYLPPGADKDLDGIPDTIMPTILYVHGGPWVGVTHWNGWFHTRNFQLLANRGYVVINTEFRGTSGLGKEMTRMGDGQWGEAMHYDLIDIANWAAEMKIADRARTAMWGWSYGGYATAAALAFAPERFICGLAMYGPADLDTFSRIPFTDNDRWRRVVGNPYTEEGAEDLRSQSPYHNLDKITKPLLLTTGAEDERVPKDQVDAFAKALSDTNKEVVYFFYPEEVHDYRAPESWISFWAIAEQFLHDHLGGPYQHPEKDLKKGNFVMVYGKQYGPAEE